MSREQSGESEFATSSSGLAGANPINEPWTANPGTLDIPRTRLI